MSRLLLLALLACDRPRDIPEEASSELAEQVRFCERMDREVEDWCVFEAVHSSITKVEGDVFYALCRSMRETDARDACLELFARRDEAAGYKTLCQEIQQQRLRESCYLTSAERVMRTAETIVEAAAACDRAGNLKHHCLNHLPAQRQSFWSQRGGLQSMAYELQVLVQADPYPATLNGFGHSAGLAARALGAQGGSPICSALGSGEAARTCQAALVLPAEGGSGSRTISAGAAPGGSPGLRRAP